MILSPVNANFRKLRAMKETPASGSDFFDVEVSLDSHSQSFASKIHFLLLFCFDVPCVCFECLFVCLFSPLRTCASKNRHLIV